MTENGKGPGDERASSEGPSGEEPDDEIAGGDRGGLDHHRQSARVRAVYDRIADHFARTRHHAWPEIEAFLGDSSPATGVGLDIGCGNGRHARVLSDHLDRVVGVDLSRSLLEIARAETAAGVTLVQGAAGRLPVESDTVSVGLYVATLHHLPDRERRRASLRELNRVLAPDGRALVSAWSSAHDRFDGRDGGFDTTIDWTLPGGETVPRFYHIYGPEEFERDLGAGGLALERTEISSGNCYAAVRSGE